jgi:hypothetical protein
VRKGEEGGTETEERNRGDQTNSVGETGEERRHATERKRQRINGRKKYKYKRGGKAVGREEKG